MGFNPIHASNGSHRKLSSNQIFGWLSLCLAMMDSGALAQSGGIETRVAIPGSVIETAVQTDRPDVFGTIAVPLRAKPTSTRWTKVMGASLDQPGLMRLAERARPLSPQAQAAYVQSAVNLAIRTAPPAYDCSDDGYWAPANETLARGMGDCFDVAIAKMEALRLLGIPETDLFLTTGYFGVGGSDRRRESAALLVRIDDRFWLMAEHADQIIEAGISPDNAAGFVPMITYGVRKTWVHGRLVKGAPIVTPGQ